MQTTKKLIFFFALFTVLYCASLTYANTQCTDIIKFYNKIDQPKILDIWCSLALSDQHTLLMASLNITRKIRPNIGQILRVYTRFSPSQYLTMYEAYKNITEAYPQILPKRNTTIFKLPSFNGVNQTADYFKGLLNNFSDKLTNNDQGNIYKGNLGGKNIGK